MKRDPLFFRLFKDLPGCFFHLVGRSERDAAHYELEATEYKATAVRLDGVFRPLRRGDPAYLWEVQFYASDKVYANLMAKIGRFLEHDNPNQDWVAVVIYPSRVLEQKNLDPYRLLLASNQLVRIYLDELPPPAPEQFDLGILELIAAKPEVSLEKARAMVPRIRDSKRPKHFRRLLLQFVETVIVYQFPKWTQAEIEAMLQVTDISQTRVYQDAFKEGREEGWEEGIESVALRLLKLDKPIAEIAEATGLTPAQIRKLNKKARKT